MAIILITGVAGNIGSSLAVALLQKNHFVVGVDNLITGFKRNLPQHPNFEFLKLDVNKDSFAPLIHYDFKYVFHLAAFVGVRRTLENPMNVFNDFSGIQRIANFAVEKNVDRLFFSSSSEVYGEPVEIPQVVNKTPLNATLPYALMKSVGESYFKSNYQVNNVPYTVFRYFNTYGPHQSQDFVMSRFIMGIASGEPIKVYGDGRQTRSFCYVDDNVEFMIKCMEKDSTINRTYNVGHDREITILELISVIEQVLSKKAVIKFLPARVQGDMKRRCPEVSEMRQILNRDLTTLETGIRNMARKWELI